ncbi:hemolysin family protein [Sphingobacterium sp. lm-10]|uniref:hemolysin family protein n=1 Tax=Sphingobacterium sp. lm-10 TaxID=2944904 RepID=UPI002021AAA6|nr:hemolysin family protein [Sphingobacterium sp. lm-10]MCL7987522.1 hemolysin family protein [Sphingobacterium sp. lm-10]
MITEICIILLLIFFNAILAASETAILASRKSRLQVGARKNRSTAAAVLLLKNNPNRFLLTIQIGITLIGIMIGVVSSGNIATYLANLLVDIPWIAPYHFPVAIALIVLATTYLALVIGELVPKRMGTANPERYAAWIAKPMMSLNKLVRPFTWMINGSADFISRLFKISTVRETVTEEEIKALVDEGVSSGIIEHIEHDLVDRILRLGDKKAINLMVHRSRITYLDINNSFEVNKAFILEAQHTEYPVCDGSFDEVRGVVHIKALFRAYLNGSEPDLAKLVRPIPYVHENSLAYAALETLRQSEVTQAIVVDEYGSPQGIITMYDIMGTLVGGLAVEEVSGNKYIRQRTDGTYMVDGSYQIDDFFSFFDISISEKEQNDLGSTTTVAGLVFLLLDQIPQEGDMVSYKNLSFEVIDMDAHRIDKLSVSVSNQKSDHQEEAHGTRE